MTRVADNITQRVCIAGPTIRETGPRLSHVLVGKQHASLDIDSLCFSTIVLFDGNRSFLWWWWYSEQKRALEKREVA